MTKKGKASTSKQNEALHNMKTGAKRKIVKSLTLAGSSCASIWSFPNDLVPLLQPQTLRFEEIHAGTVWIIRNFLSQEECNAWIDFCDSCDGLEYTSQPGSKYLAPRECFRLQNPNASNISERLYRRMQESNTITNLEEELLAHGKRNVLYRPVGFNPNMRLYKYTKGPITCSCCAHKHKIEKDMRCRIDRKSILKKWV